MRAAPCAVLLVQPRARDHANARTVRRMARAPEKGDPRAGGARPRAAGPTVLHRAGRTRRRPAPRWWPKAAAKTGPRGLVYRLYGPPGPILLREDDIGILFLVTYGDGILLYQKQQLQLEVLE